MKAITSIGILVVMVALMFVKPLIRGFVLMLFWSWFIIPFQVNGMEMTYGIGVGIALIVSLVTFKARDKKDKRDLEQVLDDTWRKIKDAIIIGAIYLFIGYIIKLLFM